MYFAETNQLHWVVDYDRYDLLTPEQEDGSRAFCHNTQ